MLLSFSLFQSTQVILMLRLVECAPYLKNRMLMAAGELHLRDVSQQSVIRLFLYDPYTSYLRTLGTVTSHFNE